jgi:hypothetical protein
MFFNALLSVCARRAAPCGVIAIRVLIGNICWFVCGSAIGPGEKLMMISSRVESR